MPDPVFEELLGYVGFGQTDAEALRELHPLAQRHFPRIAEVFYARILEHPNARRALAGEAEIGRLKKLLVEWMGTTLLGPWDLEYFERRSRIGRAHVRIGLPQHYMFGGMNVLRREFETVVTEFVDRPERANAMRAALDRILDVELGIMLYIYREDQEVQRLAAVRTLTAGLSHEIRNPLNAASLQLAVLEKRIRRMPGEAQADALQPLLLVQEEIRRLDQLLEEFLRFARPHEIDDEPVLVGPLIERVTELLATDVERRGISITLRLDPDIKTRGEESRLREVVMNLLLNALDASPQGGEIRVSASAAGPDQIELRVEDAGAGVSPELREKVFQPFFTTKPRGSGLGLAIVQGIVSQHGGRLHLETSDLGGASFRIQLPTG
ncbi:MAG: protoglobin domain-containing protein [Myxococcaceae bacterium]